MENISAHFKLCSNGGMADKARPTEVVLVGVAARVVLVLVSHPAGPICIGAASGLVVLRWVVAGFPLAS